MSSGMNKVILLGNLGSDPELRYVASGTALLNLRMATNETYLDKQQQRVERTDWHTVVLFGPRAEGLARVLVKGSCVCIEGSLRQTTYEKDGQKRYRSEIHAREVYLTSGPTAQARGEASPAAREEFGPESEPEALQIPPEDIPAIEERPAPRPSRSQRAKNGGASRKSDVMVEEMPF